jgi:hypothetical protein
MGGLSSDAAAHSKLAAAAISHLFLDFVEETGCMFALSNQKISSN